MKAFVPEARNEYGLTACAAMKRITEVGLTAWFAEELATPSSTDPDWCRMVLSWYAEQRPQETP